MTARRGEHLELDRPWRVPPGRGDVVAVGTAFYQNQILDNRLADGMTGIQLWISCVENVIADNVIERMRKPGLFLYANGTTLASSMPPTWNRGISPPGNGHAPRRVPDRAPLARCHPVRQHRRGTLGRAAPERGRRGGTTVTAERSRAPLTAARRGRGSGRGNPPRARVARA